MVEFALVIPFLILILMGLFDLGHGIYAYGVVSSAAREGARYGIVLPDDNAGIITQAKANTVALNQSQISVTVAKSCSISCYPGTDTVTVNVTYNFQPVTLFFAPLTLTGRATMTIE